MSKYQESLNFIVENSCPQKTNCKECIMEKSCNALVKPHLENLQELVDKATPKKVNNEENHYVFETYELSHVSGDCPNCGSTFYYDEYETLNYCQHCGQALGWSKDENC